VNSFALTWLSLRKNTDRVVFTGRVETTFIVVCFALIAADTGLLEKNLMFSNQTSVFGCWRKRAGYTFRGGDIRRGEHFWRYYFY